MFGIRSTDWIGLAAALLLSGATAYFLLGADLRGVGALTAEQEALAAELDYLTDVAGAVAEGNALLETLQVQTAALAGMLPAKMEFETFFQAVTDLAEAREVALSNVEPGPCASRGDYIAMPVSLSASTRFEGLQGLLFDLKQLPRISKLERMSCVAADEAGVCDVSAILTLYAAE